MTWPRRRCRPLAWQLQRVSRHFADSRKKFPIFPTKALVGNFSEDLLRWPKKHRRYLFVMQPEQAPSWTLSILKPTYITFVTFVHDVVWWDVRLWCEMWCDNFRLGLEHGLGFGPIGMHNKMEAGHDNHPVWHKSGIVTWGGPCLAIPNAWWCHAFEAANVSCPVAASRSHHHMKDMMGGEEHFQCLGHWVIVFFNLSCHS